MVGICLSTGEIVMTDRIPLSEQLDELRAEYTRRCQMYPELVIRSQMRQEAMEFKLARMAAAYNTLAWLLKNADHVREWVQYTVKLAPRRTRLRRLMTRRRTCCRQS